MGWAVEGHAGIDREEGLCDKVRYDTVFIFILQAFFHIASFILDFTEEIFACIPTKTRRQCKKSTQCLLVSNNNNISSYHFNQFLFFFFQMDDNDDADVTVPAIFFWASGDAKWVRAATFWYSVGLMKP